MQINREKIQVNREKLRGIREFDLQKRDLF